jgi:hypothetical protein
MKLKTFLAEDSMMSKPTVGKSYGTTDGGKPEKHTPKELSRLTDALYAAQQAGIDYKKVFALAPDSMKLEWNYACWKYVK